ncbi:DNA repair ATPase [Streptomyces sp. NPDC046203]|uniref:DNA repair ATPase n=1 Tax=Streptomyces sp. NPDC046203 TaxID=3154602 RepID=UPI0033D1596B
MDTTTTVTATQARDTRQQDARQQGSRQQDARHRGAGQQDRNGARAQAPGVDEDAYAVLRDRLVAQAAELASRAEALNEARTRTFGSGDLELTGTGQLRTADPCVLTDLVTVDPAAGLLLAGRTRPAAARSGGEPRVSDVFALYDREFEDLPEDAVPGLLDDPAFVREFTALHRYFQGARLVRLRRAEGRLLAVFRTAKGGSAPTAGSASASTSASGSGSGSGSGEGAEDLRVLRWEAGPSGTYRFLDAQGERDLAALTPPAQDVEWRRTGRDDQVPGRHPHVSLGGRLFVSTVGGTLTLKTVDDTETREGVYTEPVDEPLQSLADAEVAYAAVGPLLLVRVRPYKEETVRHLVFHTLTGETVRLDGLGQACLRLPDDRGVVFPGGYCLADGTVRTFDTDTTGLVYDGSVASPHGEDVLYAFRSPDDGRSLLLPYNRVRETSPRPVTGRGHALLDDGTMVVLRAGGTEAGRVHTAQVWRTPFTADTYAAHPAGAEADAEADGPLVRIGNADLVRGISDCLAIARLATETSPAAPAPTTDPSEAASPAGPAGATGAAGPASGQAYEALAAACARAADLHHWLGDPGTGDLAAPLDAVRVTAAQVLAEFETVTALAGRAADALAEAERDLTRLVRQVRGESPATAGEWISRLTALRRAQGRLLTVRELRYADTDAVDALARRTDDDLASAAQRAVSFLRRDDAFTEQAAEADRLTDAAAGAGTVAETRALGERVDEHTAGLRTLSEVVAGLDIADATVRTGILERIADVLGGVNRARATLASRRAELLDQEGRAEFTAEFALLAESVTGALADAATPEDCDTRLGGLLLQLENLESRFAEHDGFLGELGDKRVEIHDAFAARRQTLTDARARRAERLAESAVRVLESVTRRAAQLGSDEDVHTYFASDPMVAKVRRTADELRELGDQVRAEELAGRLAAARQEAGRALRDRADLYDGGGDTIRLGRHRFAVQRQTPELTLVPQGDALAFALTGTDYRAPVDDPELTAARPYWSRSLPSESPDVYRAEYLAARLLAEHGADALAALALADAEGGTQAGEPGTKEAGTSGGTADSASGGGLAALVRQAAEAAYDEGYERGVHDHDATAVLRAVLRLGEGAGVLRHPAAARAAARFFWAHTAGEESRARWQRSAVSLTRARDLFGTAPALDVLRAELAEEIGDPAAAAYLVEELAVPREGFAVSAEARTLLEKFRRAVGSTAYDEDVRALADPAARRRLVEGWLHAYATASGEPAGDTANGVLAEAAAVELCPELGQYDVESTTTTTVTGLLGAHPRLNGRTLDLDLAEFLHRTAEFTANDVPAFRAYQRRRAELVTATRARLRLDEHKPRVMSSFVRGRLVDEVYLPLIGDNLAKQLGAAGDAKRSDTHGLLMLLSPPGYGKTTLVEYVADRLGLLLVKVDGPALGRATTSLDPAEAPDSAARRELEKIAFALAAGNNVMLYVDDIQHCSPDFLQKFIPLCDATRTLAGHDLRGKRFAVCMAGNPYTESGGRFRVPDMLANRADVWNLGDVLTGKEDAFAFSFVENALTSHPDLAPLAGRDRADTALLTRLAAGDPLADRTRLQHPYAPVELDRLLAVLRHLLTARSTVLAVNEAYIASAAQADEARTEPPFRLQGSYRNMNKIVARISPAMNDAELAAVVDDHYTAEAQTLTGGAEANLLRLAALRGTRTPEQEARWRDIVAADARGRALGGSPDDPLGRAVAALGLLADRIAAVETAITRAADPRHLLARPASPARHARGPAGTGGVNSGTDHGANPGTDPGAPPGAHPWADPGEGEAGGAA